MTGPSTVQLRPLELAVVGFGRCGFQRGIALRQHGLDCRGGLYRFDAVAIVEHEVMVIALRYRYVERQPALERGALERDDQLPGKH